MPYSVPDLTYGYDALAPHIDEQTMRIHHDKHHQAYVDKANAALEGTEWADKPVEDVLKNISSLPQDKQGPVRNNAGGHANHSLFWRVMSSSSAMLVPPAAVVLLTTVNHTGQTVVNCVRRPKAARCNPACCG